MTLFARYEFSHLIQIQHDTNNFQATTAYALKKVWPEIREFHIVPDAGHSAREPGIRKLLVKVIVYHQSDIASLFGSDLILFIGY